jgi:hypothetical protein
MIPLYVDERLEGDATIRLIGGLIAPGQRNILLLLLEIYNAITLAGIPVARSNN